MEAAGQVLRLPAANEFTGSPLSPAVCYWCNLPTLEGATMKLKQQNTQVAMKECFLWTDQLQLENRATEGVGGGGGAERTVRAIRVNFMR